MGSEDLLRAVIKRAFDDLSLLHKRSDDPDSHALAEYARVWIFGVETASGPLDDFMGFKNLCESLRLPYHEMIKYAKTLVEGEHEQFRENKRAIVWSSEEYTRATFAGDIDLELGAQGLLCVSRFNNPEYTLECQERRGDCHDVEELDGERLQRWPLRPPR